MNTGKIVAGVIAGAAVGALIGVLFAPDKGSETRKKISQKGGETLESLKQKMEALLGGLTDKFEKMKEDVNHLDEKEMRKAESIKNTVKNTMS